MRRLHDALLTEGSGLTENDVNGWVGAGLMTADWKDVGFRWQILNGDAEGARETAQYLYGAVEGGQTAVRDNVLTWLRRRSSNGTATDWEKVRSVLRALGFADSTIASAIGN
jgi:hypothetical protein